MPKPKERFAGLHHAYYGLLIALIGFFLGFWFDILWGRWLCPIGVLIFLDDVIQHFWGVRTPLKRVNDWLWLHFRWYQKACEWWDKLFGKR